MDDSFQKMAVAGFDPQIDLEHGPVAMKVYMENNFPIVDARYSVVHSGSWQEQRKHRKTASVGLIDVGSPDVREMLIKAIESKDFQILVPGQKSKCGNS